MTDHLYRVYLEHPHICTDTRKIEANAIFFALKGPNFNANAFAGIALEKGCAYAVIDDEKFKENDRYILVPDALKALQELATRHRKQFNIPFIGITGSNGKTTTKELLYSVLSKKFKTIATQGNLNNHIGVPLTVLSVTKETEIAIIEMGANHIGEIALLCSIAKPTCGVITNIGKAHLEGFGSFEGVIKAKVELYESLKKNNGTIFLHNDNQLLKELSGGIKKITYGKSTDSDYNGKFLEARHFLKIAWKKRQETQYREVIQTQIIGSYNLENILAAISIGNFFGVEKNDVKSAIESYLPDNNRSQVIKKCSNTIILDCYNANPASMSVAINNFAQMGEGKKIAILGDMLELGQYSQKEHESIIEILKPCDFSQTILVGKEFSKIKLPENFKSFLNTDDAIRFLQRGSIESSLILIKGSRGIKLEKITEAL